MQDEARLVQQIRGEAQVAFGLDALRGVVVLNGGGVLALMTFIGQAWSKDERQARVLILLLKPCVALLLFGAVAGILAQGLAYLAQQSFVEGGARAGKAFRAACVFSTILGVVFFAWGTWIGLKGLA